MKIESLVGLASFFADKEEVEFALMLDTDGGFLFAVGLRPGHSVGEDLERTMTEELNRLQAYPKGIKVCILEMRHSSVTKYALKNGIPVFCRDETVLRNAYRKVFEDSSEHEEKALRYPVGSGFQDAF